MATREITGHNAVPTTPELSPGDQARAYLETVPIKVAAAVRFTHEIDGLTLVACRPFVSDEPNPLVNLSAREYEVLVHAAHSQTNPQIGADVGLANSSVGQALTRATVKLGVHYRYQAATYIPIEAKRLSSFTLWQPNHRAYDDRELVPKLGSRQAQVYDALVSGDHVSKIANDLRITPSTINTTLSVIFKKLGVSGQTELLRLAGAVQTVERSAGARLTTAEKLVPLIRQTLIATQLATARGEHKQLHSPIVRTIKAARMNPRLVQLGYRTADQVQQGKIDAVNLVAHTLLSTETVRPILQNSGTRAAARLIIQHEVAAFLRDQAAKAA